MLYNRLRYLSGMKIKLILAADRNDPLRKKDPFMPLSLPILAGSAPDHEYEFIDMLWDSNKIDFNKPVDLVGISIRLSAEETAYRLSNEFRKRSVPVVLGGPQVSAMPYEAITHADAIAIGEGEKLWPVIVKDTEDNNLKNFYVCSPRKFDPKGGSFFQLEGLPELSHLPNPKRTLFRKNYTFDMVFAARGCPIDCDFCTVTKIFGNKYRMRPVDEVVKEIAGFRGYYYLLDDTVFGRPSTYDYYLELFEKIAHLEKRTYWTGQANLDAASTEKGREVIRKAVEAGFVYAAIGIESINNKVLVKSRSISKMGIKDRTNVVDRIKENITCIQDQGILISGWFTIGYEDDDIDTYYRTYEFCRETNILPVFTPVHALPGSRLYTRLEKEGKLQDIKTNVTNVSHSTITNHQILQALGYLVKNGYSLNQILKRTRFYRTKFTKENHNSIGDKIHKTIFTYITQTRMRRIIHMENEKLRRKVER